MLIKLLCIGAGGGVGAIARYALAGLVHRAFDTSFPLGTLVVNALGCLAIGVLGAMFAAPHLVREETRLLLMVGLLGGFTTFSSFGLETFEAINEGNLGRAGLNIALSVIVCLAAVWVGYRVTEHWIGA